MRPTRAYGLYCLLFGAGMGAFATTYVPFLRSIGLTLSQVALVNVICFVILVAAELPTGMLADGISRAWSVRTGAAVTALGTFAYSFADGVGSASVCEGITAVGLAFCSGAEQAWFTDALKRRGEGENLSRAFATAAICKSSGFLIAGLLGAFAGLCSLKAGWWLGSSFLVSAFLTALLHMNGDGEPLHRLSETQALRASLATLRSSSSLLWAVGAGMAFGLVVPFNHYWTVFYKPRIGQLGLGLLWVPMYGACVVAGTIVRRRPPARGKEADAVTLSLALVAVCLTLIGHVGPIALAVPIIMLHQIGRGMFMPLVDSFIQHRVDSGFRATYGSLQSFLSRGGIAVVLTGVWLGTAGMASNNATIIRVWSICGSLLLLFSSILWFTRPEN